MAKKPKFKASQKRLVPPNPSKTGSMRMFDLDNPDIDLFNMIDDELIRMSGSELYIYKYEVDENFDDVFGENRAKALRQQPILVEGHYDPRAFEENLTEFGIEMTNDQLFTFNKSYIEAKLGRPLIAGDVIQPRFQNVYYDVYEVVQDGFEVYGVYHLVASAKILREKPEIIPDAAGQAQADVYDPVDFGEGPGYIDVEGVVGLTQTARTNVAFGPNYSFLQQKYIKENIPSILFSRDAPKVYRDPFISGGRGHQAGLYSNFVTVTAEEWAANPSWQTWAREDVLGDPIVTPGGEYLMDIANTEWLDARIASFPDYATDPTLENSNLTYLFLDLCNLYPVDPLGGVKYIGAGGNAAAWREDVLGMVDYVRTKIHKGVEIVPNGVRAQVGVAGYVESPITFYTYDGADLIVQDKGDVGVIETNDDYGEEFGHNLWVYGMATALRVAKDDKPVIMSMHCDLQDGIPYNKERISNWASFALIYQPGRMILSNQLAQTFFLGNTPLLFPENAVDLGYPVDGARGEVPAYFTNVNAVGQIARVPQVLSREFESGYVALFNTGTEHLPIPTEYQGGYIIVDVNADILLRVDGSFNGKLKETIMGATPTIAAGRGLMLRKSD